MTEIPEKRKITARKVLPPLIIGSLGTTAVIAYYFLVPRVQLLEVVLLLVVIAFAMFGSTSNIIRGVMSGLALYVASGLAALLYQWLSTYVNAALRSAGLSVTPVGNVDYDSLAFSFGLLMLVIWIVLEAIGWLSIPDASLPALGFLDNLGGALIYLLVGILVAALLFNMIGYSQIGWDAHYKAQLRPRFNQVIYLHYKTQAFWFRWEPLIYTYDLDNR